MHTYSDFMYNLKELQFRALQTFHSLPFYWDPEILSYTTDPIYKRRHLKEFYCLLVLYLYVAIQFVRLTVIGDLNQADVLCVVFMALSMIVFGDAAVLWKLDDYIAIINKTVYFANRICSESCSNISNARMFTCITNFNAFFQTTSERATILTKTVQIGFGTEFQLPAY